MTTYFTLLAALCGGAPSDVPPPLTTLSGFEMPILAPADSLQKVYEGAASWESFYAAADGRRALWIRNSEEAEVEPEIASRARAAGGPWRILAISESRCSDSVSTIPFIAKLAAEVPSLELRVINSTEGRPWMEAHRSPDGRAATPTVLVLDGDYRIRGCWIEQPLGVQDFWLDVVARGTMTEEVDRKLAWYEEDAGRSTLREFVAVLEGAHSGAMVCPGVDGR